MVVPECPWGEVAMRNPDPYPAIGRILVSSVHGPWTRIVLDAELYDGAARFEATAFLSDNSDRGVDISDVAALHDLF